MIDVYSSKQCADAVSEAIRSQKGALDESRADVRPLKSQTRRIHPRSATSISIVGTDGGNNQLEFDPFLIQLVRVVDSFEMDHCLEVVTPSPDLSEIESSHLDSSGHGLTPLGRMMELLEAPTLTDLSVMISGSRDELDSSWINVYRELQEWAVLLDILRKAPLASDTLLMRDGWLRTKVFRKGLFAKYRQAVEDAIAEQFRQHRRRVFLAGVLKRSKVLQKYQLAMMLENIMRTSYPCYISVPPRLQDKVFKWGEIVGIGRDGRPLEDAKNMVAGEMFFVKFGSREHDRIWVVDLWASQSLLASETLGYMLADALVGFPMPFFPMSLQRAHEHASIGGFDTEILQQHVSDAVRATLGDRAGLVDELELLELDGVEA